MSATTCVVLWRSGEVWAVAILGAVEEPRTFARYFRRQGAALRHAKRWARYYRVPFAAV